MTALPPNDHPAPTGRLRVLLASLGCTRAELLALAVLAAGALAALLLVWVVARPGSTPAGGGPSGGPGDGFALAGDHTTDEVVVHVSGEVTAPGLYRLPDGARVADALEDAGGPTDAALLEAVNLARLLSDGEQLVVPGPAPAAPAGAPAGPADPAGAAARRPDGRLDLNVATAADLEELPGIGPVLAERIVEHRDRAGRFGAVGDLRAVPGIGEKKFQALAEHVTV